jgi:hypothetical protein
MNLGQTLAYLIHGTVPARKRRQPKRRRGPARNAKYRAWIRSLHCLVEHCSFRPCHAAHTGHDGGAKQKASDYSCVPLCPFHHLAGVHQLGRLDFERRYGLNLDAEAARLFETWRDLRRAA